MNIPVIHSLFPPALYVSVISGKKYIVPQWIEVPLHTNISEVHKQWKPAYTTAVTVESNKQSYEVLASNGKDYYTVTYERNIWHCSCPAYGFRRKCKHIESIRNRVKTHN